MYVLENAENQYPRHGSLNRNLAREKHTFLKVTSLNPKMFQGPPSPLAETR